MLADYILHPYFCACASIPFINNCAFYFGRNPQGHHITGPSSCSKYSCLVLVRGAHAGYRDHTFSTLPRRGDGCRERCRDGLDRLLSLSSTSAALRTVSSIHYDNTETWELYGDTPGKPRVPKLFSFGGPVAWRQVNLRASAEDWRAQAHASEGTAAA